jgi:hypothetical protein
MTTGARGLRNGNPGNIRAAAGVSWVGQTGVDAAGFCIFDTPDNGLRALCKLLKNYQLLHELGSVRQIISRWAPPAENNTAAYITAVANAIGVGADATINLRDASVLAGLCAAIVMHENGQQPFPLSMIRAAAQIALGAMLPLGTGARLTPAKTETFFNVAPESVEQTLLELRAAGAKDTSSTKQPDGRFTVVATYEVK